MFFLRLYLTHTLKKTLIQIMLLIPKHHSVLSHLRLQNSIVFIVCDLGNKEDGHLNYVLEIFLVLNLDAKASYVHFFS